MILGMLFRMLRNLKLFELTGNLYLPLELDKLFTEENLLMPSKIALKMLSFINAFSSMTCVRSRGGIREQF